MRHKALLSITVWGPNNPGQSQCEDQTIVVSVTRMAKHDTCRDRVRCLIHMHSLPSAWHVLKSTAMCTNRTELTNPSDNNFYFLRFASPSISDNPVHSIEAKDDTNINNALYRLSRHYFYLFSFCFLFMLTFQILFSLIFLPGTHFSSLHVRVSGQSTSCKGIIIISLYAPQMRGAATKKWLL